MNSAQVGDAGTGKTTFVNRIVHGDFRENVESTIGMDYHLIEVKLAELDYDLHLQMWDTAGQERFQSITRYVR